MKKYVLFAPLTKRREIQILLALHNYDDLQFTIPNERTNRNPS